MNLDQILEAVLFASGRPLGVRKLSEITEASTEEVENALEELSQRLETSSGLMLQEYGHNFELVTKPNAAEAVKKVVKDEEQGELTRASLEALTILAYRGPMTRPELEQVRGIQSAMILRNLMIRGLVEQKDDERLGQPTYAVTFDFLKHLGLSSVKDLPDYEVLRGHAAISDMLEQLNPMSDSKDDKPVVDSLNV
ncbi:MAG TPA: SMC-Scp complex subunit ScpB [bacterium]|nr:MAG: Segregation and condensation protein B [Parcubacteria group bacterium ADurb.Bin192]HPN14729.1 SMC-Scp complex subunit ScpB [bacterium]